MLPLCHFVLLLHHAPWWHGDQDPAFIFQTPLPSGWESLDSGDEGRAFLPHFYSCRHCHSSDGSLQPPQLAPVHLLVVLYNSSHVFQKVSSQSARGTDGIWEGGLPGEPSQTAWRAGCCHLLLSLHSLMLTLTSTPVQQSWLKSPLFWPIQLIPLCLSCGCCSHNDYNIPLCVGHTALVTCWTGGEEHCRLECTTHSW